MRRKELAPALAGRWRRAAVTGGSAGIGRAFAELLGEAGTDLVLIARDAVRLKEAADDLTRRHGVEVATIAADLSDPAATEDVAAALTEDPRLDLLVNNVGSGDWSPFADRSWQDVEEELARNVRATLRLSHAVLPGMQARSRGDIVNVAAGNAFYPTPYAAAYASAKAFVVHFTQAVDFEIKASGVRMSAVCPGFTRTGAAERVGFASERIPKALWKDPEDVAETALRGVSRGRSVVHPGAIGRMNAFLGRHAPVRWLVPAMVKGQMRYRRW